MCDPTIAGPRFMIPSCCDILRLIDCSSNLQRHCGVGGILGISNRLIMYVDNGDN